MSVQEQAAGWLPVAGYSPQTQTTSYDLGTQQTRNPSFTGACAGAQFQLGLEYANATPTFTLAHSRAVVAARTMPPQYAAAALAGAPAANLTDAAVYAPIRAAMQPLLKLASAPVGLVYNLEVLGFQIRAAIQPLLKLTSAPVGWVFKPPGVEVKHQASKRGWPLLPCMLHH